MGRVWANERGHFGRIDQRMLNDRAEFADKKWRARPRTVDPRPERAHQAR
jgi:hypothetical protein